MTVSAIEQIRNLELNGECFLIISGILLENNSIVSKNNSRSEPQLSIENLGSKK